MEKPGLAEHPILEVFRRRWSPRAFSDRPVEPQKLRVMLEAARWAPSSFNEQPWVFFLATRDQPRAFEEALSCLVEKNQKWAKGAPVLMLTATRAVFTPSGKSNRVHQHDLGLAMGQLVAQATALDLFVHQMAGIVPERVREAYDLPAEYEPQTGVAIGYGGEPGQLPEEFREAEQAERERLPLSGFVFEGRFGEASPVVKND